MVGPRIVSLLPSATEIAVALGFGENLVGRSHECDFPPWVERLPVLTASKLAKSLGSLAIDVRVKEIVETGLSVYEVDAPLLRALRPDVILTQTQCAICAVTPRDLEEALGAWQGMRPTLLSLAPDLLTDVWDDFRRVGAVLDGGASAPSVIETLLDRLITITQRALPIGARPTVAAIEWIDPLIAAGNWVPELIAHAGGEALFVVPGEHSPWLEWDALAAADPDVIVLMPCGYQLAQTLRELAPLVDHPRWHTLSAVRSGRVFAADGHHFFNRPGPRLVESAQILADVIDPLASTRDAGRGWVRVTPANAPRATLAA